MRETIIREVKESLHSYHESYFRKRKLKETLKHYISKGSVVGTGLDEIGFGEDLRSLYERDLNQAPHMIHYNITSENIRIINDNTVLVVMTIDLETTIEKQKLKLNNTRSSIFLVKENNKWLIAHKHISLPTVEHEGDESYPVKELEERNQALQRMVSEKTSKLNDTIDELIAAKENLLELNKEKDKFFSIVAHDIKSPFNTLLGFTDLLANSEIVFEKEKLNEIHKKLYGTTQKTYQLLENLLEWAGNQMRKSMLEILDIHPALLVEDVLQLFQATALEKNIELINQVSPHILCQADENIFKLIIRNLVSNAIKFSHPGSPIYIYHELIIHEQNEFIKIIVKDQGIGMKKEQVDSLFSLSSSFSTYGTHNESGNGLGLIFTRDMVTCLNGAMMVTSKPGEGTEMAFTLRTKHTR